MNLKPYLTERNVLLVLISLLLLATFLDIYTALRLDIFEIAETNPIYVITGSKGPLLIITFIVTIWLIKNIKSQLSLFSIFTFTLMTIYLIFGHGVGIYFNISTGNEYKENPEEVIKKLENYNTKEKFTNYFIVIGFVMFLPYLFAIISFSIAMFFYNKRKPKREKIIGEIHKLSTKLMR